MKGHNTRAHALLSASGSSRWMNCTPSPRLEEKIPSKRNRYADEGTFAHEYSENEIRFQTGLITKEKYSKNYERFQKNEFYSEDLKEHCQKYIDYVMDQFHASNTRSGNVSTIIVEERVDFSEYVENGFGTSDVSILEPKILEVIDLKYGKGVRVSPIKNSQGMLYGIGSLKNNELVYDFEIIKITIVQPRLDIIETWEITKDDLISWAENEVRPKALIATEGAGELNPGDWCRFCKVKNRCPAMNKLFLKEAQNEFSEPLKEVIQHELLSDQDLLESYAKFDVVSSWMNSVSEYLLHSAIEGKKWEGYKLVEGKSQRKIKDPEKLMETLKKLQVAKKNYMVEKMIPMTQMETFLKKRKPSLIQEFIIKPEGSPTLVSEKDSRIEWSNLAQAKSDFAEMDEIDELFN